MYKAIKEKFDNVNQRLIAKTIGITETSMSRIVNGKQNTSKTTAYCIVKAINENAEIEEYFIRNGD